ncbi:MAG: MerR family transcriptional regulator [Acidobacteriaceae bacterium]|nr:MerR family transcriptional regulator [Acidobacteriaceae bacterium]
MNRKKPSKKANIQTSRIEYLTVGQTARILGISPSTLRLWENVGLINPARSTGKYRLYSSELLEVLKRIKYLRDVKKLSVPGIKQMLGKKLKPPIPGPNGDAQIEIGAKLRQMRQRLQLGIVEAAAQAKISPGFLSAIELAKANPSVATLQRLAATYNTTVLEFFSIPRHARRLIAPHQRRVLKTESGVCIELLSIGTKMLECMIFRVPPKAGSDGSYSHAGEEFIYMLQGELEIWLDEWECHTLKSGDSFWFESNLGHRWFNPSKQEAVLIWVNTPITF